MPTTTDYFTTALDTTRADSDALYFLFGWLGSMAREGDRGAATALRQALAYRDESRARAGLAPEADTRYAALLRRPV